MRRLTGLFLAFALYLIAAFALLCHRSLLTGTLYLSDGGMDASLYIWVFRFLPDAVIHFQNPFILKNAWAPFGLNITQATTTPLLALLGWPITALVGPIVSFNIVTMATPALAAAAAFAFVRSYIKTWGITFAAGWIYGFSPAVFGPLLGHLQTSFIALLPLAFLAVRARAAGKISSSQYFMALLLALAGQFLVSLETFVTESIFLSLFAFVTEITRQGGLKRLTRIVPDNLAVGLIAAYVAVTLLMSPFIYYFFIDYRQIPHTLQNGGAWVLDLANLVIPTPITWLGGDLLAPISQKFNSGWSEDIGYIGLPLLLLTLFSAWRLRREKQVWPLLALLGAAFICALGPRLHILGQPFMEFPWSIAENLPFLSNALPVRLMPFVVLSITALCAYCVDCLIGKSRVLAISAFGSAAIFLLHSTFTHPKFWNVPTPVTELFATPAYQSIIRPGETVLFLPFGASVGKQMFWQAETGRYFRMTNGYGNFVAPGLNSWPAAIMLAAGTPGFDFTPQFNMFVRANGINKLVVTNSALPAWQAALESSGWNPLTIGNLTVFSQLDQTRNKTAQVSQAQAQYLFEAAHFLALRAAAGCTLTKGVHSLDMMSATTAHCLSPYVTPSPGDPHANWDSAGGWLGFFGNGIGLGVTTDAATAGRIVATVGSSAQTVFFPYPQMFQPNGPQNVSGELLEVFSPETIIKSKQTVTKQGR